MKSSAFQPASLIKKKNVANKLSEKPIFLSTSEIDYQNLKSDPI